MKPLTGKSILIASGPTSAPLDDVRTVTNKSSGRLGSVIAYRLHQCGARVEQLAGRGSLTAPALYPQQQLSGLVVTPFETVDELKQALQVRLKDRAVDAVIMAAAVLDYIPERVEGKKSSSDDVWTVIFRRGEKLIEQIQHWAPDTLIVGFKLESRISLDELTARAENLMARSQAKIVIANRLEEVCEDSHIAYMMVSSEQRTEVSAALPSREAIAERLAIQLESIWRK
ncbi:MAG: phosphopantothenoylcysteine decarboxylase [Candidatus Hinthialibacter antarcticus]|nr:phosphopantothenoylcysteine decarboxylase [Candidatus Hinthialibacter antarcticus]